ncbi:hypothetical protein SODALDRAFT_355966 [Sodiomyces alkalinus F11]|uniref:Biogenesis of lysosome-related organelles complex 1 subunit 1 n=1 Tax=Sodiomyces alkalinus (strain CBS 110278 / VKM F-3762 / F11) TaxID=1314773 RepID=A0A3N2QAG5_SODAK|nr:hypothetical protein SODALDRAFT_355966 [Sodiomyces alkalinus F11]ROT43742.1 hypothetical protein SODALDRAFT_355966 [Sodiomyces alkalinus F11]
MDMDIWTRQQPLQEAALLNSKCGASRSYMTRPDQTTGYTSDSLPFVTLQADHLLMYIRSYSGHSRLVHNNPKKLRNGPNAIFRSALEPSGAAVVRSFHHDCNNPDHKHVGRQKHAHNRILVPICLFQPTQHHEPVLGPSTHHPPLPFTCKHIRCTTATNNSHNNHNNHNNNNSNNNGNNSDNIIIQPLPAVDIPPIVRPHRRRPNPPPSISNLLDSELQTRARTLHGNAAAITRQERDVGRATAALRVENDKLARWSADAARRVKELGSVQNWAEVLEREFLVLEETVRLVKEGSAESGSEGRGGEEDEEEGEEGSEASWCSGSCCRSRRGSGRLGKGGDAAVDELRGKGKRAEQDADGDVSMGEGRRKPHKPPVDDVKACHESGLYDTMQDTT